MAAAPNDITRTSLNLTEAQWAQLIHRLEAGKGPSVPATRDRRDLDVLRYTHVKRGALRVQHAEGPATSHLVRTRNISSGGVGFIHSTFLYPATLCHIALQTRHGESVALAGRIMWCRHIAGKSHEIGLRFAQLIQVDEFVADDQAGQAVSAA